jgi:hypothetical protein
MSAVLTTLIIAGNAGAAIMQTSAAAGLAAVAQIVGIRCFSVPDDRRSINLLRKTPPATGVTGGNATNSFVSPPHPLGTQLCFPNAWQSH